MEAPEIRPRPEQQGWVYGPPHKWAAFWDQVFLIIIASKLGLIGLGVIYYFYLLARL